MAHYVNHAAAFAMFHKLSTLSSKKYLHGKCIATNKWATGTASFCVRGKKTNHKADLRVQRTQWQPVRRVTESYCHDLLPLPPMAEDFAHLWPAPPARDLFMHASAFVLQLRCIQVRAGTEHRAPRVHAHGCLMS